MCRVTECPRAREDQVITDCRGCSYGEPEDDGIDSLDGFKWAAIPAQND